jgi:crotonobetainyl-CoA:carnitine CoA-transferase CaiB-like acyl-CoA transferase
MLPSSPAASLAGLKVLDLSRVLAGPWCTQILGDLGADVVKVERPGSGDDTRGWGPPFLRDAGGAETAESAYYLGANRNKRSIAIDLACPAGQELARELARHADVLVENYKVGDMARYGLDFERLHALNPQLVYCSITGFGDASPYAARPCYDTVAQALSGYLSQFVDLAEPRIAGPAVADAVTGMYAAQAILAALFDRGRGGKARRVEIAMLDSMIAFAAEPFASYFANGVPPGPYTRASISQSYAIVCGDGKAVALHLASLEKFWRSLVEALGDPALERDERFRSREQRVANYEALRAALGNVFARQSRDHWIERLVRFDVPHAPLATLDEVTRDAHVVSQGLIETAVHPAFGEVKHIRRPAVIDGSRGAPADPAPALGEQTAAVLGGLGYTADAIDTLRSAGVI